MNRILLAVLTLALAPACALGQLLAGVARRDITERSGRVNDPCFAKALVLKNGDTVAVLVTIDAVAIGEIGGIGNAFLSDVRARLEAEAGIPPASVLITASHCHGVVRKDTLALTVEAVKAAVASLVPVTPFAGSGAESRISENRRLMMKDGSEVDMRRAYSLPRDEDVASVGPIDPQIGILRLDRAGGQPLAIIYNFACHPIMNPPSKGNSADFPGFASQVIESALGGGAMAFFIQGCGGDINPIRYKETSRPADAEPLGTLLGSSLLAAVRALPASRDSTLKITRETIALPRAADYERRIGAIEAEQKRLMASLKPTNINFKSFLPLLLQHRLWPDFPSHHAQSYLHDRAQGREGIAQLDADNRVLVDNYLANIDTMERLTRLNTNLALLKKNLAKTKAAGGETIDAEICGLRVGEFRLVTFPGELTVQIGLDLKKAANHPTAFVAGYTNGYIYYLPTETQRANPGYAQEDCDTLVAPQWQRVFEEAALRTFRTLGER